jgi:hypothetical protein
MHALHRPRLPHAISVTVIAAVLAIVLALALALAVATSRNDVTSTAAPTGAARAPAALQAIAARHGWSLDPFAPLLSMPAPVRWAPIHS